MKRTRIAAIGLILSAGIALAALAAETKPAAPAPAVPVAAYMWDLERSLSVDGGMDRRARSRQGVGRNARRLSRHARQERQGHAHRTIAISDAQRAATRLAAYAGLKADEDVRIAENRERQQLATSLGTALGEKTAWVTPGADRGRRQESSGLRKTGTRTRPSFRLLSRQCPARCAAYVEHGNRRRAGIGRRRPATAQRHLQRARQCRSAVSRRSRFPTARPSRSIRAATPNIVSPPTAPTARRCSMPSGACGRSMKERSAPP